MIIFLVLQLAKKLAVQSFYKKAFQKNLYHERQEWVFAQGIWWKISNSPLYHIGPKFFFPKFTIIQTPGSWYINRGDKKVEILYLKFQILKLPDSSYATLFHSRMLRMTSLECRLIFLLSFSHFSVINSFSLGTIKSCLWVRRNGGGTWSVIQFFLIELPIYKKLYLQYTGKNMKLLQFLF